MQWLATPNFKPVITMALGLSVPNTLSVTHDACCIVAVGGVTDMNPLDAPRHIPSRL